MADGYAAFRVASGYVKQVPSDWFMLPPSYEKDQGSTGQAVRELARFRVQYPRSKYAKRAGELYEQCVRRLVEHELYVARFYLREDKPQATIMRLEASLKLYPDVPVNAEVLLLLGETYLQLEKKVEARKAFSALAKQHPKDERSKRAREYLRTVR